MNILCLNTSFNETYVAVSGNQSEAYKTMDSSLKQSENVLGAVDFCLNNLKLNVEDLNIIACVIGPGSFTGIRIGASLVKGFCMAYNHIKKIEINSLDLLAFIFANNKQPDKEFYVVLNGLSGNIFACKYNQNGERLTSPEMLFGEQINEIKGIIVGLESENMSICNSFVNFDEKSLLSFAKQEISKNNFSNDFNPLYLRKSQAEAELDKKNGNN